ncbi:uncharacterized protein EpC_29130 [Erwinia pyrifoliae Ep1/96]|nr:uncharacterized protein EpC_29130 [Erwinia pyrifoliae Ep1/96]
MARERMRKTCLALTCLTAASRQNLSRRRPRTRARAAPLPPAITSIFAPPTRISPFRAASCRPAGISAWLPPVTSTCCRRRTPRFLRGKTKATALPSALALISAGIKTA